MPVPILLPATVVVITGASSGIGRATAVAFARQGASVVLAARGEEALAAAAADCEAAGGSALVVPTDVTDAGAVRELAAAAIARFGHIDVWVNNVGVGAVGRFDEVPIEAHRRVVETNLVGHMNGAHAVLPHFRQRARGTLVNMISIGGWASSPYAAAYSASKFGIRGFSEAVRTEVSDLPNVHVCEVYPTFVDTPGLSHGANYTGKGIRPPPPLLDPREVADTIVTLARAPRASVSIGSVALPARLAHAVAPDLVGRISKMLMDFAFVHAKPAAVTSGNLFAPSRGTAIDGGYRSPVARAVLTGGALLGVLAIGWSLMRPRAGR